MSLVQSVFTDLTPADVKQYCSYWQSVAPSTSEEVFKRWLFAFTSIHTTWEGNVRGYNAIKNYGEWIDSKETLLHKLDVARVGMQNVRTEYIWSFATDFWANQSEFSQKQGESWAGYRNRLVKRVKGIGMAKVSFTLEMVSPLNCGVVCLDTHMLQLFKLDHKVGYNSGKNLGKYISAEQTWVDHAVEHEVPSYIARCMFWDKNQNQTDSRYWSHVLEA